MFDFIRQLVSMQRRRYTENGFDLDLSYITPRLIAMSYPAQDGLEAVYRNPMWQVQRFLEAHHPGAYKVFNLCSEQFYDAACFGGRVERYPFEDHDVPPLGLVLRFCRSVQQWLNQADSHVAVVHCRAGKGRTGLMTCCYLVFSGMTGEAALALYAKQRTLDHKGVTIASQQRYVRYWEQALSSGLLERDDRASPNEAMRPSVGEQEGEAQGGMGDRHSDGQQPSMADIPHKVLCWVQRLRLYGVSAAGPSQMVFSLSTFSQPNEHLYSRREEVYRGECERVRTKAGPSRRHLLWFISSSYYSQHASHMAVGLRPPQLLLIDAPSDHSAHQPREPDLALGLDSFPSFDSKWTGRPSERHQEQPRLVATQSEGGERVKKGPRSQSALRARRLAGDSIGGQHLSLVGLEEAIEEEEGAEEEWEDGSSFNYEDHKEQADQQQKQAQGLNGYSTSLDSVDSLRYARPKAGSLPQMEAEKPLNPSMPPLEHTFSPPYEISGDICLKMFDRAYGTRLFTVCFNTAFVPDGVLSLKLSEVDKVQSRFRRACEGDAFCLEIMLLQHEGAAPTSPRKAHL